MRLLKRFTGSSSAKAQPQEAFGGLAPHLQICAHTDDDLYFMSPDLLQSVQAGIPVVSVYLTTGESDGINLAMDDPARPKAEPDYAGYTAARQHGIRAAYAAMVTGSRRAEWTRSTTPVSDGVTAEVNTLEEGRITLVFLNLRTGRGAQGSSLQGLWNKQCKDLATLRPEDSPIPARRSGKPMTRSAVIETLADLLTQYQPALVRIMNPDPDRTAFDAKTETVTYCDNSDHTAAAYFALAALARYEATAPAAAPAVESYLGYCNKLRPNNLSPQEAARKFRYLAVYGGEDGHDCEQPPGRCGDRPLGNRAYNRFYGQSTSYRWLPATNWLQLRSDGRLTAFAVLGGRPVVWTQDEPGGASWTGPAPLGQWPDNAGRCTGRLDVVRDTGGRIHVVAVRISVGADPAQQQRSVMHIAQSSTENGENGENGGVGEFGEWTDLASPYRMTPENLSRRRALGMPVVAATGTGGIQIVQRNFGTGLSGRRLTDSGWEPWSDLKGGALEGAAAVTLRRGTIELYATNRMGMLRWFEQTKESGFKLDYGTQLNQPAGPVAILEQTDERLLMFSRQPGTGWILAHRQQEAYGTWNTQPEIVCTTPGFGPLAHAQLPGDRAALIQRTDDSGLSLSIQALDGSPAEQEWISLGGGPFIHAQSAALDAHGHLTVAFLDAQAHLTTLVLDASEGFRPAGEASWRTHEPALAETS